MPRSSRLNASLKRRASVLLGLAALCAVIVPGRARADAVTDWNAIASNAIVTSRGPAAVRVGAGLRDRAGGGLRRGQRDRRRLSALSRAAISQPVGLEGGRRRNGSVHGARGAVPRAAGDASADIRRLRRGTAGHAGRVEGGRQVAVGESAAAAMLAARANDGRCGPAAAAIVGTAPGVWRPTMPFFAADPHRGSATSCRSWSRTLRWCERMGRTR